MPRHITDEATLWDRVLKMLPKNVPPEAIEDVECDPYDGEDGGPSYWVYTAPGWLVSYMDCHTIHEDTLAKLKPYVQSIVPWPDDPELDNNYEIYNK